MSPDKAHPADLDERLRALRSRTRREILALVWDQERAAGEIAAHFTLTPATISEHLSVLRAAGLVSMTQLGTSRRYRACREALTGLHGAVETPTKWQPADDIPERSHTTSQVGTVVTVVVDVPVEPTLAFSAFVSADLYSRWLQVPVRIDGDRFSATLEWGTEVRGRYDVVAPPSLIAMSWDFEDDNIPVPGRPLTAYLRIRPIGPTSRIEVHQLVDTDQQAAFMQAAWGLVLGRLAANLAAALTPAADLTPRPPRRKGAREPS